LKTDQHVPDDGPLVANHKNTRADDRVDVGLTDFQDNGENQIVCGFVDGPQIDNGRVPLHPPEEADLSGDPWWGRRVPQRPEDLVQSDRLMRHFVQSFETTREGLLPLF
jgi:hypothetical protein